MRNIITLLNRELTAYYFSPLAYIIIAFFLAMSGFFFYLNVAQTMQASLRPVLGPIAFITMMIAPLLSMRLLAEERKSGTLEVLLTAPVTSTEVVVAKFLGALFFYVTLLLPTVSYLVIFWWYGGDWSLFPTLTFYLGLTFLAASYLSVGILVSSLTNNQVVAAFVTFVVLFIIYLLFLFDQFLPGTRTGEIANYFSWFSHLASFEKGILDTKDIFFFLTNTTFFLFLTVLVLDFKRDQSPF